MIEFWELFILLCKYDLSTREIKYLLWKFGCDKNIREIAKDEGITFQAVSFVLNKAYRKIKKGAPWRTCLG